MAPTDAQIVDAARSIVLTAAKAGNLESLTKALVRVQIESELGLEPEGLKEKRKLVSQAVDDALDAANGDLEESPPSSPAKPPPAPKPASRPKEKRKSDVKDTTLPSKKRKVEKATKSRAKVVSGSESDKPHSVPVPNAKPASKAAVRKESEKEQKHPKPNGKEKKTATDPTPNKGKEKEILSESELSVLIDDEPPRKKKGPNKPKQDTAPKQKSRSKAEKPPLDADAENIKKLKALVVACGVRKQWAKEFTGMDSAKQQISHIKSILNGLGMTGRMSLDQAKVIKQKRELAQEIEDVKAFDAQVNGRQEDSRVRRSTGRATTTRRVEDSDEDEESNSDAPAKRGSKKDVLAFLANQSSDSE